MATSRRRQPARFSRPFTNEQCHIVSKVLRRAITEQWDLLATVSGDLSRASDLVDIFDNAEEITYTRLIREEGT